MRRKPLVASLVRTQIQPQYPYNLVGRLLVFDDQAAHCLTHEALRGGKFIRSRMQLRYARGGDCGRSPRAGSLRDGWMP
jgi:hypothetical protein